MVSKDVPVHTRATFHLAEGLQSWPCGPQWACVQQGQQPVCAHVHVHMVGMRVSVHVCVHVCVQGRDGHVCGCLHTDLAGRCPDHLCVALAPDRGYLHGADETGPGL